MKETYSGVLKNNGLKVTPRRRAVIDLFLKAGRRLGPLEVHRRLAKKVGTLGRPTVYRILEELEAAGILLRVVADDRQLYYTLNKGPDDHHHHFVCRRCQRIEEVVGCQFDDTVQKIERKLGCRIEAHLFQLEGLCAHCA